MKPGYKQTDLGVLPEEWEVSPIGPLLLRKPDYGINAAAVPYSTLLPAYLRITDISEDGEFIPEGRASVDHAMVNNYFLEPNDIVLARTGASVGKSYLYKPKDGRLVYAGFLIRLKTNPQKLDARFLKYNLQTNQYWQWVTMTSVRSGQPGINGSEYAQLQIPLPPPAEQQAIAEALGAMDALLTAQRGMLAKKRDLKQATQQALLSGETRLPGFLGEWDTKLVKDFTSVVSGGTPSTTNPAYWGGDIKWMSSGELHQKYVTSVEGRITEEGLASSASRLIPVGCVLIGLAGQGKTRGTAALNMIELCTNQSIASILPSKEHDSKYLFYNIDNRYDELRELSTGDGGRGGLNLTILNNLEIPFPKPDEQRAIAATLRDMDTELEALTAQVAKTQALKQGMMQDLLTGAVRLAPAAASPSTTLTPSTAA